MKQKKQSKMKKNSTGFTIIEVIVSMAILGLIAISLLALFTNGYSTIFSMGRKTEASNEAQAFIEAVYEEGVDAISSIAIRFNSTEVANYADMNPSLYDTSGTSEQTYHNLDTTGTHPKITVMVFYQNGSKNVKLSALVP